MVTNAPRKTTAAKRRRAAQRDIMGGALLSIANALQAQLTALQTHHALDTALLLPGERRALAKLSSQLALIERYLRLIAKHMSYSRDTRPQQAQWNGDSNGQ